MNVVCCVLDNRGIGLSSTPTTKTSYTTERMAQDVIETAVRRRRCVSIPLASRRWVSKRMPLAGSVFIVWAFRWVG